MKRTYENDLRPTHPRTGFVLAPKRSLVPGLLLVALVTGCVLEERDPVLEDTGPGRGDASDASSTSDGRPGSNPSPDGAVLPDAQRTDAESGSTTATDASSDRTIPPTGQDGGRTDTGSLPDASIDIDFPMDRTSGPDVPSAPDTPGPPDATMPPPTGQDSSVPDVPMPPKDTGPTCPSSQIECSGSCVSPTAPETCGSCTHDCTALPRVSGPTTCQAGACVVPPSSCTPGWAHCSSNPDDGCEVDISKPEHCGSCTNVCTGATPLCAQNGDAGTSSFQCKSQCSAPSPDLCGMSCTSKLTDPLNCGMCGTQCTPPASHGQPICAGGQCQTKCDDGYDQVGTDCVQLRFYIAENGNDSAAGTQAAPFKTWKRAATRASLATQPRIYFNIGVYPSNATGEDFTTKIPEGATVSTIGGKVLLQGNGVAGFAFAGSGSVNGGATVDGINFQGFSEPLSTSSGTQTLTNVTLTDIQTPMLVRGISMTINGFAMSSTEISGQFRVWSGTLSLSNGTLTSVVSSCLSSGPTPNSVESTGILTANQVTSDGTLYLNGTSATLTGVTLISSCASENRAINALGTNVTLDNCQVNQYAEFSSSTVKVRGTTFDNMLRINDSGTYDFGKSNDHGNNNVNGILWVYGPGVTVNASGNHWTPGVEPADGNGNVPPQTIAGPYNLGSLRVNEASSSVIF